MAELSVPAGPSDHTLSNVSTRDPRAFFLSSALPLQPRWCISSPMAATVFIATNCSSSATRGISTGAMSPIRRSTPFIERIGLSLFGLSLIGLRMFSVIAQAAGDRGQRTDGPRPWRRPPRAVHHGACRRALAAPHLRSHRIPVHFVRVFVVGAGRVVHDPPAENRESRASGWQSARLWAWAC